MAYLKKYPTRDDVSNLLDYSAVQERIAALSGHERVVTLASYTADEFTPELLRVWADLLEDFQSLYRDAKMDNTMTITREKSQAELRNVVLDQERTARYYHPDRYAEYTEEDMADL